MKLLKSIFVLLTGLSILVQPQRLDAKNIYVANTTQGSGNGVDPTDAHGAAWFSTSANWGSGPTQINPGDTVHLCGTISTNLIVQASGLPGNPTTIFFEPGAAMINQSWNYYGAINISGLSWITVDGGVNGLIQDTSNGTLGVINPFSGTTNFCCQQSAGVFITGDGNGGESCFVTVQNLTISNLYVIIGPDPNEYGQGVEVGGATTNITVRNCTINNADQGVFVDFTATDTGITTNLTICSNQMVGCNHSIELEANTSAVNYGTQIFANVISNSFNWDAPWSTPGGHHHIDGMILSSTPPNSNNWYCGMRIFNNLICDLSTNCSAWLYLEGNHTNELIYNNIFVADPPYFPANGFIGGAGWNAGIYNNTCVSWIGGSGIFLYASHTGYSVLNNLVVNCYSGEYIPVGAGVNVTDYNVFYNLTGGGNSMIYTNDFLNWSGWQGFGLDRHSSTNDPVMANMALRNYRLLSGSAAISTGTNLSALFALDFTGSPRPASGPWDVGAYQYVPALSAPTGLRVVPP